MDKKILQGIGGLIVALSVGLTAIFAYAEEKTGDDDPHMTGLPLLTREENEKVLKTHLRLKKVKLNKLGLERINEYRGKKGLTEIPIETTVELGEDIVAAIGEYEPVASSDLLNTEVADSLAPESLPESIDNSTLPYFPPIRSQGPLNSCGSFSGTYYAMTYMYAFIRNLDAKTGGDNYRFTPKWNYNMINGGENVGSWYYDCYDIGIKHGCATWSEFPYDADFRAWCLNPVVWKNSIYRRFNSYGYVGSTDTAAGLQTLKEMLVNGYILNIATYIYSWQYKPIGDDPSTTADNPFVGKNCCYWVNGTSGYHAMTVVGYNDNIWVDINGNGVVDNGEKGAFRIANSWGTGWGEAGYVWMAYDALKSSSAVSGGPSTSRQLGWYPNRAHYVTAKASYTPLMIAEFGINQAKRIQMQITLGISDTSNTTPTTIWYPDMLNFQGGAYAFNGTTTACDGTFVLDFTDLVPTDGSIKKYYLGVRDSTTGDICTLQLCKLIDLSVTPSAEIAAVDVPKTADGQQIYSAIEYQYHSVNLSPIAIVQAVPTQGDSPLFVSFSGTDSYDPDGTIATYAWDFGDGATGTGSTITHTYNTIGTFVAKLTVIDNDNASSLATVNIIVNNKAPVAVAEATPTSGIAPLPVSFNGSSSYDPDGTIATYAWAFGDGATATGVTANHTYASSGTYVATLTVTDDIGVNSSNSVIITVNPDPNVIAAPSNLAYTKTPTSVTLTWTDNSNNEGGFTIERGVKVRGILKYTVVNQVGANVTTYTENLRTGTYYYRVQAYNTASGNVSGYSNIVTVTISKPRR